MILLELLLKEAGASCQPFVGSSTSSTYLLFQMSLQRAWHDRLAASDGRVTWGRDNSSAVQFHFSRFSFWFWGLGSGHHSEQCPEARSSSQCKSGERSPSAPRDHVSFPRYIPHMPCWIWEGFILNWKTSHILDIDKTDLNFNSVLGDPLSPLQFSQERLLFLSALVVKALCTIWTCWLSNHIVYWSVFLWKCMAASTWGSDWG